MKKARRPRSDSVKAMVDAAVNVSLPPLRPPPHVTLSAAAELFFPAIIEARARIEWRTMDLVTAAQLAECQAAIQREQRQLDLEGMIEDGRENPRVKLITQLTTRELAIMRALQMGGIAGIKGANSSDLRNSRMLEVKARQTAQALGHDEPAPTPTDLLA